MSFPFINKIHKEGLILSIFQFLSFNAIKSNRGEKFFVLDNVNWQLVDKRLGLITMLEVTVNDRLFSRRNFIAIEKFLKTNSKYWNCSRIMWNYIIQEFILNLLYYKFIEKSWILSGNMLFHVCDKIYPKMQKKTDLAKVNKNST